MRVLELIIPLNVSNLNVSGVKMSRRVAFLVGKSGIGKVLQDFSLKFVCGKPLMLIDFAA